MRHLTKQTNKNRSKNFVRTHSTTSTHTNHVYIILKHHPHITTASLFITKIEEGRIHTQLLPLLSLVSAPSNLSVSEVLVAIAAAAAAAIQPTQRS